MQCYCLTCSAGLTLDGRDHMVTDARGKVWTFEMHPQYGPIVLKANGDPATLQPGTRSKFWQAFELWQSKGEPVAVPLSLVWLGDANYAPAGSALAIKCGRKKSERGAA